MRIIVQKFGGTSVEDRENLLLCARRVVEAKHKGYAPVVVVSAPGRRGPYSTDTLINLAKEIDPQVPPEPRELDLLMTCGEIVSIVRMAQAIKAISGWHTIALTGGQAGIYTDYNFGNARILKIDPSYLHYCLERGMIPVVAGFQGVTEHGVMGYHGAITTLVRGGSDTTAGALAAALGAQACEIYTDVEGVMTADPGIVGRDKARVLPEVTYEEVCEMAHLGARVVHPRCAEIAMQHRIPLWVKKFDSDADGTVVKNRASELKEATGHITGITHSQPVTHLRLNIGEEKDMPDVEREIYRSLGEGGVSIYFMTRARGGFEFVLMREDMTRALSLLDGLFIPVSDGNRTKHRCLYLLGQDLNAPSHAIRRRMLQRTHPKTPIRDVKIELGASRTIVSVVAVNAREMPGVMAKVLEAFIKADIPILQTSDSQHSISLLVSEEHTAKAVCALHDKFELHKPTTSS